MKRLERASILLLLVEHLKDRGSWCGETHVQKGTYFLQELMKVPLEFEFILYKHGPFSFDLSDQITAMRADSLFRLQPQPYPYGPSILPDKGAEAIKRRCEESRQKYTKQVDFVADKLRDSKVADLERYATALYVTQELGGNADTESRASRMHTLKPHVSIEDALKAIKFIDYISKEAKGLLKCLSGKY